METVNVNTLYTMDTSYQNNILYKAFKFMQYKEKYKKIFWDFEIFTYLCCKLIIFLTYFL